jgi:hypothetical protein
MVREQLVMLPKAIAHGLQKAVPITALAAAWVSLATPAVAGVAHSLASLDTVATGPRNEAVSLVSACRDAPIRNDGFLLGYCKGYIASKLGRLSQAQLDRIETRWKRKRGAASVVGSNMMTDTLAIIRSPRFDDRNFSVFAARFNRPVTAEDVLDHILTDILYVEDH